MIVDFELIEYIDFIMGFLSCMAISLTMYLVMSRKGKRK